MKRRRGLNGHHESGRRCGLLNLSDYLWERSITGSGHSPRRISRRSKLTAGAIRESSKPMGRATHRSRDRRRTRSSRREAGGLKGCRLCLSSQMNQHESGQRWEAGDARHRAEMQSARVAAAAADRSIGDSHCRIFVRWNPHDSTPAK